MCVHKALGRGNGNMVTRGIFLTLYEYVPPHKNRGEEALASPLRRGNPKNLGAESWRTKRQPLEIGHLRAHHWYTRSNFEKSSIRWEKVRTRFIRFDSITRFEPALLPIPARWQPELQPNPSPQRHLEVENSTYR